MTRSPTVHPRLSLLVSALVVVLLAESIGALGTLPDDHVDASPPMVMPASGPDSGGRLKR